MGQWLRAVITSKRAAINAPAQLHTAQETQEHLRQPWLEKFAVWINEKSKINKVECCEIVTWQYNRQWDQWELLKDKASIMAWRWASWRLHCLLFMLQVGRRPRTAGLCTVGFDGQSRGRRANRMRRGGCGLHDRERVRPKVIPNGWVECNIRNNDRCQQQYHDCHEIEWVLALEAPEEGDRRAANSVESVPSQWITTGRDPIGSR